MNKTIRLLIYAALLLFLFFGLSTLYKGCNKEASPDDQAFVESQEAEEYDIFADAEEGEESDGIFEEPSPEPAQTSSSKKIDYDAIDEAIEEAPKALPKKKATTASPTTTARKTQPAAKPKPKAQPAPSRPAQTYNSYASGGKYLVIAGSYLVKDNAQKMVSKLRKLGYQDAEIVVFDERKYHTVCSGRYSDHATASNQASLLKRKGIDCYVHTRQ